MERTLAFSGLCFLVILLPYLVFSYDFLKPEVQSIYIKGVLCNASEKFAYKNLSCFGKSYNRSFSTFNVIVTGVIPVKNIFVSDLEIDSRTKNINPCCTYEDVIFFALQVRDDLSGGDEIE